MKPAAIYARVSSDKQKEEHTIASQTEALRGFARQQGFSVPDEWVIEDEGYSGATLVRPGLERVRDLAAEGQIDAVLVYSPDRLSRKYAYQVLLIEELARHNVQTVFIKAPQTATPEDQLLLQFQGMIAEYERAQILERSRRGKRHRALQGVVNVLCGAPYGYRYIRKTEHAPASYAIIDAEATVVRKVYEYYTVAGLSIGAITRLLNEQGVPTRKRISRWERSVVWAMLRNPAYKGTACFNKTKTAKRQRITRPIRLRGGFASRDSAHHERPREEWIEIAVPPIVTEETFGLAAERLQANKDHAPRRTITPSVVQGLVSCRKCSYGLYRTSTRTSARMIYYYRCLGSDAWRRLGGPVCDSKPIRQDLLDEVVWREILKLLESPHLIQEELERRLAVARNASPVKRREENLQRELARVRKSMERLMTAYQEDLMSLDDLRRRMPELRKCEQAISSELNAIESQLADRAWYLRLAETVTGFLARLRETAKTLDVAERQRIVRLLVKEILVDDDTIVIRHSIPAPTKSTDGSGPTSRSKGRQSPGDASYLLRKGSNLAAAGEPILALRFRHVDGAGVPAHPVRALCRRRDLSLPYRGRGACPVAGAGVTDGRLQADAASGEDENRLLQGCQSERRLLRHPLRLLGIPVPGSQDDVDGEGQAHLHAWLLACGQSESTRAHRTGNSRLGLASPQRQIPERAGRDNPAIRGWIAYYSHFYRTQLRPTLRRIDAYVIRWGRRKYKRMVHQTRGARDWFDRLRRATPKLFAHWPLCHGNGRTSGAV